MSTLEYTLLFAILIALMISNLCTAIAVLVFKQNLAAQGKKIATLADEVTALRADLDQRANAGRHKHIMEEIE